MFQQHINGYKHRIAISRKHTLHSMLSRGSIKTQISSRTQNSEIERVNCNRKLLVKLIKTVHFMCMKKWAVKNNFFDLIKHIRNNATYISKFTEDQIVKICSEFIQEKFLINLVSVGEFAIFTDESTDKVGRAQLGTYVCCVDTIAYNPKEECVAIRKLGTGKTPKTIMRVRSNVS